MISVLLVIPAIIIVLIGTIFGCAVLFVPRIYASKNDPGIGTVIGSGVVAAIGVAMIAAALFIR